jgi:hypothetical protein
MRRWIDRLLGWLGWSVLDLGPYLQEAAPALVPNVPGPARTGHHFHQSIHDILDALPVYFEDLRALRRVDRDAYQIFSTLGGQIAGDKAILRQDQVEAEFLYTAPAVRCAFLGHAATEESNTRAIYLFRVASKCLYVTPTGNVTTPPSGLSYRLSIVWRCKGDRKAFAGTCFVNIDDLGNVVILNERTRQRQTLPGRKKVSFVRALTAIPSWIGTAAAEHNKSPEAWVSQCVAICASARRPKESILVRASLGDVTAAWTIARRDAKRFFRERETGTGASGARKRVLHYVAEFTRNTARGLQTVREHYRGEREFTWKGYAIAVSGLDFHHSDFFDSPIEQSEAAGKPPGMMSLRKATGALAAYYNRERFLSRRKVA